MKRVGLISTAAMLATIAASGPVGAQSSDREVGSTVPSVRPVVTDADADRRAARIVDSMTTQELIQLLRPLAATSFQFAPGANTFPTTLRKAPPAGAISSAGFVPGIPRINWPALQESDGPIGVSNMKSWIRGIDDQATNLPSSIAWAAAFDPRLAHRTGEVIGAEAHSKGFNVMLSGGVNLAREPLNGRNFEYAGEDPLLAGRTIGASIAGTQSRKVVSTIKHFAFNDQESGRSVIDVQIASAAARESDLLAFEIAIAKGRPGSVMCSYNLVDGDHACESKWLLNDVLRQDWKYRGWVMSDWGGVHDMHKAIAAGLDQQSPQDKDLFAALPDAVTKGQVPRARIRDMAFRIVRSMIAVGAIDNPAKPGGPIDQNANIATAQAQAEAGAVLLKNEGLLPLAGIKTVVIIGGYADVGVLVGGGGSMVNPYGGIVHQDNAVGLAALAKWSFVPSSPLAALRKARPDLDIKFDDGKDPVRAAGAAREADVAIVFGLKLATENFDVADLSLPNGQDALISAVAAANPRTAVVLETGNAIDMPWLPAVKAVLQAWYPGQRGGEAIANLLTGKVAPSGRLPITFPRSLDQLVRPAVAGYDPKASVFSPPPKPFTVSYDEGSDVGYRWFERTKADPLFAFGHGLTYTRFRHSDLKVAGGRMLRVSFTVTNIGERAGTDVPQLYVAPPGRTHRLAGWSRITLAPGESRRVTIAADPWVVASYERGQWTRTAGIYDVRISPSARLDGLAASVPLAEAPRGQLAN